MRALMIVTALAAATSVPLSAVTPEELAALAKAGLGDEVLLALVDATGVDRPIDAKAAIALRDAGVSQQVIAAAIRASHATPPPAGPESLPVPCETCANVAVIGAPEPAAIVEREIYYVPWIVAVPAFPTPPRPARPYFEGNRGFGRFINDGSAAGPTTTTRKSSTRPAQHR